MSPGLPTRTAETDAKLLLAENLKLIRAAAGFTSAAALGKQIQAHESVIAKAETGERPPTPEVMQCILDACGITGLHRTAIEGIWKLARSKDGPVPVRVAPWFETEARAHTLRYWAPVIVPGIVQTPAYARELFVAMGLSDDKVSEFMEVRMGRQAILDRTDPPDIAIVLWEPVLHHQIGSRELMRDQLSRLVDLSYRPTVMIHVLPSSLGANPGLGSPINLAATEDAPELLLTDGLVEDHLTQDPGVVRKARATFNTVRADALNRADSRNRLVEAIDIWSD